MIFIIGLGRSGTSLLQSILNAHSEIAFLPETHFLRKYVFTKGFDNKPNDFIIKTLNNDTDFMRAKVDVDELVSKSKSFGNSKILFDALAKIYLTRKNKKIIGEKDPRNIDFVNKLLAIYPNAKFIHIVRDPRDIVASRIKADWSSSYPFIFHPLIINAQFKNALKGLKQIPTGSLYKIHYEELISSPENEMKKLCIFIGVKFEKEMLNYSNSSKELVADSEMQWKKETFNPVMKNNFNKWKKNLSKNQIYVTQIICFDIFKNSNYQKETLQPNVSLKMLKPFLVMLSIFTSFIYPIRILLNK